ncbi:MAG TPA: hypothetical protein PK323_15065 [Bacteroidia bacterium]|nr:hypothetical protein [Bacteroidia bacterium]
MKSNSHIKLLQISFFLLLFVAFNSCKRYKHTVIKGRLVNVAINKGVADEPIALMAVPTGNSKLPDKGRVEMTTVTDSDGYFEFVFEGYSPISKDNRPSYAIEVVEKLSKKNYNSIILCRDNQFNLHEYFNDDLLPFVHVRNTEIKNDITIKVVTACKLNIYAYNQVSVNNNDEVEFQFINKFGKFVMGFAFGPHNGIIDNDCPTSVITGETTFRAIIKKNGNILERDTTFFVEDKEYNLVYRY